MADQTIPPALTPEEWRTAKLWHAGKMIGGHVRGKVVLSLPGDHQHAAAALALYGQPFGFTQEDVASLQWAVARLDKMLSAEGCEFPASVFELQQLKRLRARLAALLPQSG